jgi:hypothetical protein
MTSIMLQVQLQQKIKQEAEQFRQWKASREKELLQVCKTSSFIMLLNLFMLLLVGILKRWKFIS